MNYSDSFQTEAQRILYNVSAHMAEEFSLEIHKLRTVANLFDCADIDEYRESLSKDQLRGMAHILFEIAEKYDKIYRDICRAARQPEVAL